MPEALEATRWGATPPTGTDEAVERLVDAAEACFDRQGIAPTTIDDVARQAHVSRATVYRYVRDRDDLVLRVLQRTADRYIEGMTAHLGGKRPLGETLVESIVYAVQEVGRDPRLAELLIPEAIPNLPGAWTTLYERTLLLLGPMLERAKHEGALRPALPVEETVEWVLRIVLSLLTVTGPVPRDEHELREFVRRFLVDGLLAPAPAGR